MLYAAATALQPARAAPRALASSRAALGPPRVALRRRQQNCGAAAARRLPPRIVTTARRGGGGPRRGRPGQPLPSDPTELVKQYALPALGLLVVASLVGPLVGGLVMGALGLGVMIAGTAAALSISWVFVPLLAAVFGLPALMAGGMAAGVFATAAAGALLLPSLIQLALVGGGLWLGASVAQRFFYPAGGVDPDGTIDVEADSVDDDWRKEVFREQREREAELREFDELLRRRDDFKRGGPGRY